MTVIFVITKNKYFNVIEETAQTMCMDFINDIVWCIIDCLYQIVPLVRVVYLEIIEGSCMKCLGPMERNIKLYRIKDLTMQNLRS